MMRKRSITALIDRCCRSWQTASHFVSGSDGSAQAAARCKKKTAQRKVKIKEGLQELTSCTLHERVEWLEGRASPGQLVAFARWLSTLPFASPESQPIRRGAAWTVTSR
jgi:hypothetical protein